MTSGLTEEEKQRTSAVASPPASYARDAAWHVTLVWRDQRSGPPPGAAFQRSGRPTGAASRRSGRPTGAASRRSGQPEQLPGTTLWHEGQFEGRRVRPPVFLSRRSDEPPDLDLADWHRRLLAAVAGTKVRAGLWRLLDANGWPDNQSCRNLLAWSWTSDEARHLVVVNLSAEPARGRIPLGWPDLPGRSWHLTSLLDDNALERDGAELADPGLFVALEPWQSYLLTLG